MDYNTKKEFSRVGIVFSIVTLVVTALSYIVGAIANNYMPMIIHNDNYNMILSSAMLYVVAVPVLYIGLRLPVEDRPVYNEKKMSIKLFLKYFCMTYFLLIVSNIIGLLVTNMIGTLKGSPVENPVLTAFDEVNVVIMFVLTVILAPLFEEIFFRKMLIDRIVKYGERTAIILSGLVFGLFHGNLNQFAYAFVLGMFFGYVYIRTGNIIYTIILHAMVNFMGSVASLLVLKGVDITQMPSDMTQVPEMMAFIEQHGVGIAILLLYELLIFAIFILGVIFFANQCKKFYVVTREAEIVEGEVFNTVMYNKGMILYVFTWILLIILQVLG